MQHMDRRSVAAIALAQATDLMVTAVGLSMGAAQEAAPVASYLYSGAGLVGLVALKVAASALSIAVLSLIRPLALRRVGLAMAIAAGVLPAIWNVALLATH